MSSILIYGPDYTGKQTLVVNLVHSILDVNDYGDWSTVREFIDAGGKGLGILNVGLLYELCISHICDEEGCEHPSDMGVGKAGIWRKIKEEYKDLMFNAHDKWDNIVMTCSLKKERVDHTFYKGDLMMPKLDWVTEETFTNLVDATVALLPIYRTVNEKRKEDKIMICSLRPDVYAGDHTGKLPKQIKSNKITETLKDYING